MVQLRCSESIDRMKPEEFWKKVVLSKKGYGKVRVDSPLQKIKRAFENGDYERWLMKNESKEEKEAVKHIAKKLQEEIDREIIQDLKKEVEKEKLKRVLEEISTKIGKDE